MASITSADAVILLAVNTVFPTAVQLQGFDVDDVYDMPSIDNAETKMGVDGHLSAGFIFVPVEQMITLQADSASNALFEQWYGQEQALKQKFFAQGIVSLNSTGRKYTMVNGVMVSYSPAPAAKRVLQARKFGIRWEAIYTAPV